jgi:hypothetical protein
MLLALTLVALLAPTQAAAHGRPVADPPRGELRVVVFGDFNGPYGSLTYPAPVERVVAAITDVWQPDLVLLPGDLVAGQSRALPDDRFADMWEAFDGTVAGPLRAAGIPYVATMGNHDASSLRGPAGAFAFARERAAAASYWSRPEHWQGLQLIDAEARPFTYAVRHGPLFVAVIDASSQLVDDAQRTWLARALAAPEASEAELRIVMGHLPLVGIAVGRDRPGEVLLGAASLRDLLLAGSVDAYVSGHQAAYFPGCWEGLELLFAGGIGGRALRGHGAPPRSAVTLVDVDLTSGEVRYTTIDPSGMQPYGADALPPSLDGYGGRLERSQRDASHGGRGD